MTLKERLEANNEQLIIAIDGPCASGKTTLANQIQEAYHATVFRMDDFFLPEHKKTKERLEEIGGNVDYERFKKEVLQHLDKPSLQYRPFNCRTQEFEEAVETPIHHLIVVEGSYALHKELRDYYDVTVLLSIDEETQIERLRNRNPRLLNRFIEEWIPFENRYFKEERLEDIVDYKIDVLKDVFL